MAQAAQYEDPLVTGVREHFDGFLREFSSEAIEANHDTSTDDAPPHDYMEQVGRKPAARATRAA